MCSIFGCYSRDLIIWPLLSRTVVSGGYTSTDTVDHLRHMPLRDFISSLPRRCPATGGFTRAVQGGGRGRAIYGRHLRGVAYFWVINIYAG